MTEMLISQINAIELILRSFSRYNDNGNDNDLRMTYLRSNIDKVPFLDVYLRLNEKEVIKLLHEKEQQRTSENDFFIVMPDFNCL